MAKDSRVSRRRSRTRKPFSAPGSVTWLIGVVAVKTGIAPRELLLTPPEILEVMIEQLFPKAHIKQGSEAWQELASLVTD